MAMLWCLGIVAVIWCMAYLRFALWQWSVVLLGLMLVVTLLGFYSTPVLVLHWVVLLVVTVPLNIPPLRRALFTNRILPLLRSALPPMSQTEKEALDAGTVWWDGDLFSGRPDWQKLHGMVLPKLSEEEQAFLNGPVEELCRMLDDWHITEERRDLPPEVWQYIKDNRFFSMIIPKQYDGLEFSALAHSTVVMKVASQNISMTRATAPWLLTHIGWATR